MITMVNVFWLIYLYTCIILTMITLHCVFVDIKNENPKLLLKLLLNKLSGSFCQSIWTRSVWNVIRLFIIMYHSHIVLLLLCIVPVNCPIPSSPVIGLGISIRTHHPTDVYHYADMNILVSKNASKLLLLLFFISLTLFWFYCLSLTDIL